MRRILQLATALTLATAVCASAQITSPDHLIAPAPRNPAERNHRAGRPDTRQWIWQYTSPQPQGNKQALLTEPRFKDLLAEDLRAPQSFWGIGVPLSDVAATFLSGPGAVTSTDNRYITVTGCVPEHCPQRGLLWIDLGVRQPLTVFSALRWTERTRTTDEPNAPFFLWIFPSRELDPAHLPGDLKSALSAWVNTGHCNTTISNVLVVEPNGVPHILGALDAGVQPTCAPITNTPGTSL